MKITYLIRKDAEKPLETLAGFLKKAAAVMKYGRTTIYEGDVYYLPYTMVEYRIEETKEVYIFLGSRISDDICVFRKDKRTPMELLDGETDEAYILSPKKEETEVQEEVIRKIRLNRKMRKMYRKYHFEQAALRTVYLPEQAFYVKGRSKYLLLVDPLLGKIDYKHLDQIEKKFAENYLKGRKKETDNY